MTSSQQHNANLLVHACERCGGDLYRDPLDDDGDNEVSYVCLQCGRRRSRPAADVSDDQRERRMIRRAGRRVPVR